MIKIPIYQIKEAGRAYAVAAEMEKEAFNINIDPGAVLGALAGGYAATSHYRKGQEEEQANEQAKRTIEGDVYSQVESVLRDLKIVFTPINVVYSVNGQIFEIIQADEMTADMKAAFVQRDAAYYRNLLVNKINMELQLAQQAFAQRLLTAGGQQMKEASYMSRQDYLVKVADEEFDGMLKQASQGLDGVQLEIEVSFDSLRPFTDSNVFFRKSAFEKVAGIFDVFSHDQSETIDLGRFQKEINVGFLPDRVVFLWNGQMIDQLSLLKMNEAGYEAFRRKDKEFFVTLFRDHSKVLENSLKQDVQGQSMSPSTTPPPSPPEPMDMEEDEEDLGVDKQADSLEDIIEELVEDEFPARERESLSPFTDTDIHPIVYDAILDERYGNDWVERDFEALLKQIEIDFELREGIAGNPFNKMLLLHTIASDEHALFQAPLTFEKFLRGMNDKPINFERFEGNVSFEEIMFGLEVAKNYEGEEVFYQFDDSIAEYVSEELYQQGIRVVSDQLYDETNPSEQQFFKSVNGYLLRKWKETDAQGLLEDDEIDRQHVMATQIVDIAQEILRDEAQKIDVHNPYVSVESLAQSKVCLLYTSPSPRD